MIKRLGVKTDQRLAQGRSKSGIPLRVGFSEFYHCHNGLFDESAVPDGIDAGPSPNRVIIYKVEFY